MEWSCATCGAQAETEEDECFTCGQSVTIRGELLHGRYELLASIGSGGFSDVYKAIDYVQREIVAIKRVNLQGLTTRQIIEATDTFNREIQLLTDLFHVHLPRIHEHFTDSEHWYLVMDFIAGSTLEQFIEQRMVQQMTEDKLFMPLDDVLSIALQLCSVLKYLHTRQPAIIFRDLKPSNILLDPRGHVFLIDFGIARRFKPGKDKDTIPFGSPGYAAPEQYGKAQTTPHADIYSLGVVLHQLLSGDDPAESPFKFAPLPLQNSPELLTLQALISYMVALNVEQRPVCIADVEAVLLHLTITRQQALLLNRKQSRFRWR
jgi:eukaryotic-like serine/threonine-protein kinase